MWCCGVDVFLCLCHPEFTFRRPGLQFTRGKHERGSGNSRNEADCVIDCDSVALFYENRKFGENYRSHNEICDSDVASAGKKEDFLSLGSSFGNFLP